MDAAALSNEALNPFFEFAALLSSISALMDFSSVHFVLMLNILSEFVIPT
jgi:hypothetical protein